ncbi:E3 SUMO-protein ligase KIAA1586-like [Oratosquilla oratoria]|uniref:E3 SUMO-protein ligase KIAA1586-like n=1 Tax=Oratosquilla oratoria TaxID=337810 RepID=UPI003F757A0D
MGVGLHSRKTAVKIVDHIAKDIKNEIFTKIIEQNLKICVIVDEASTISNKPVVIIFLKIEDSDLSPTIFFDLVELEGQGAEQIYASLLKSLHDGGFDNEYLRNNLIAFCSDGASVMLGRNSGVGIRLRNDYPNIVLWHCLNHRLQLVLDDSVNDIKQVNHFKIFMDKIYTIFHQSNKNQMQLFKISEELGQQILKIGRVLGPRWAACSLRSALAVWRSYPALYKYFSSEAKYSGMAACLCNKHFLEDLALMIDILQEISLLSNALQARSLTLKKAEQLIKRTIKAFEMLKENKGTYETKIDVRATSDAFKDIHFVENNKVINLPRQKLLETVIENMKKRVMSCDSLTSKNNELDDKIHDLINFLEPNSWNIEEVVVPWRAAEEKLREFDKVFHHEISINDFRDYVENVLQNSSNPAKAEVPQSVQKAKNIINVIAVSSAEAE